jgi:hypothetical protein
MAAASSVASLQSRPVRGWLLLLWIMLTIVIPFLALGFSTRSFQTGYMFRGVLELGNAGFGIYCGRLLWKKNPKAVAYTCNLLYFRLGISASTAGLLVREGGELWYVQLEAIGGIIGTVIWLVYLNKSKRVKNTYGLP